jgi:hypothetical protein
MTTVPQYFQPQFCSSRTLYSSQLCHVETCMAHHSMSTILNTRCPQPCVELREWKHKVIEQSEKNRILEKELRRLDHKIGLLVSHRLTQSDVSTLMCSTVLFSIVVMCGSVPFCLLCCMCNCRSNPSPVTRSVRSIPSAIIS